MKNYLKVLVAIIMFVPFVVLAEEKAYEYFDFKVTRVNGENIKATDIKIFASVEGEETNLIDRTDEFEKTEVMWSACVEEDCATSEEVSDDAVFEEGKDYVLLIRITAKNGADIDVWGTDKAKLNGTPIEELAGEYGNTGTELMIKTRTNVNEVPQVISEPKEIEEPTEDPKEEITTGAENTCVFGLSFCCTMFLGISICYWIIIAVIILLIIIVACAVKCSKKKVKSE